MSSPTVTRVLGLLRGVKSSGDGWTARCPAHEDHASSLSVAAGDDGRVLLKCFAGCTVDGIVAALNLDMQDLFPHDAKQAREVLTVARLATDKALPVEFLRSLGLEDRPDGVLIPYRNLDGSPATRNRLRTAEVAKDGSLWLFGKGKPLPYGLGRLPDARAVGYLVLVEGESDSWTLWYHEFPALGIPGADMTAKLEAEHLDEISRLYVIQEPGSGGDTFVRGVARRLQKFEWVGEAFVVNCGEAKDPNDLHRADPTGFKAAFQAILDAASPLTAAPTDERSEGGSCEDVDGLLDSCGFRTLSLNPKPEALQSVLRKLKVELENQDELVRAVAREAVIGRLQAIGVRSPARLVDATLGRPASGGDQLQGRPLILSQPEPWPDAVDGSEILGLIVRALERYVVLIDGTAIAVALWILHAYAFAATFISPLLVVLSPTRRCGKTTLLDVIAALVSRQLPVSNISPAALFRTVDASQPTLLVDEADTFLKNNDDLRGILNAGHTRSTAIVIRTAGDNHEPRQFSTWCPKVIALIGRLPDTLEDRAVVIRMRRRDRKKEKVARLRRDRIHQELEDLRRKAARWAVDRVEDLKGADPSIPDELHDRAQDNWRPLLAIADNIGGQWPDTAREAARLISGVAAEKDDSAREQLLADIRQIFTDKDADQLPSEALVKALVRMDDRPWPEWMNGKPLSKAGLASQLRPFDIRPRTIREGSTTPKGYRLQDFNDAFARYLQNQPQQPQRTFGINELDAESNRNNELSVADAEPELSHREQSRVSDVAVPVPGSAAKDTSGVELEEFDV
jgi:putative DNA primase/helicase